ncbi:MAG: TRCF domain-containing protein, partial [Acidimicrobiia bacterium]
DYIARDDLRMEAYRRLAAAGSLADVDDIASEWSDRYGPPPPPAAALLAVARVRAECVRLGIREVAVQRGAVRFAPLQLRESQRVRLLRLAPKAVVKADDEIVVPLKPTGPVGSKTDGLAVVEAILTLLAELVPPGTEAVAAAAVVGSATTQD